MSLTIKCSECGEVINNDNFWHHEHKEYEFEDKNEQTRKDINRK